MSCSEQCVEVVLADRRNELLFSHFQEQPLLQHFLQSSKTGFSRFPLSPHTLETWNRSEIWQRIVDFLDLCTAHDGADILRKHTSTLYLKSSLSSRMSKRGSILIIHAWFDSAHHRAHLSQLVVQSIFRG